MKVVMSTADVDEHVEEQDNADLTDALQKAANEVRSGQTEKAVITIEVVKSEQE